MKDGLYNSCYENDHLEMEGNYKNGKGARIIMLWYENGQLKGAVNYKKGEWYINIL